MRCAEKRLNANFVKPVFPKDGHKYNRKRNNIERRGNWAEKSFVLFCIQKSACMQNVGERTMQVWRCESRRVRTHHSASGAVARSLGRIIQRILLPNQEAALVEPFGNGLVRVGSQVPLAPANRPWVSEDGVTPALLINTWTKSLDISLCKF